MIYQLVSALDKRVKFEEAKAHCDIPCGIYDPIGAQIGALTVVRMIDLMTDMQGKHNPQEIEYQNSMSRYIAVKEEHAEKVKYEVRVIWGDYFKAQHIEQHPDVHQLVHKIMQLAGKSKQTVDRQAGLDLMEAVNQFAEIFWQTKGISTKRAKAPYAPGLETVYPNL